MSKNNLEVNGKWNSILIELDIEAGSLVFFINYNKIINDTQLQIGTTFSRTWQIRVDQIPCGQSFTPPQGCLEYHMEDRGNFKSFNFGINDNDYHHLGKQDYSVCIRRNKKMCRIAYQASEDDGDSFYTSQKPTTPAIRSRAGESGCPADYITIPNGSHDENGNGVCLGVSRSKFNHIIILY